ncbi:hypothetical protein AAH014_12235 [Bacteroides uniformis]|jgi:hypothetical protein|uniref:hypothetical protein n=1 Tax=Bacteroides TaxID=816 RepID=UPI000E7255F9|nr:hypothetical protein [Bacteroides sp. AF20-13LB]RJV38292.1 hypothetical protein DWX62_10060 [Bacteroides sp. AF20-13LB]
MKLEEYIESIFGCLERIENKINGQSAPLPEGNSPTVNNEKDESVLNEVRNDHETFRKLLARVYEGLAAIKNDMVSMDRKNSSQERLGQVLSEMHNEQRKNQEKVQALFCETNDTIRKNAVKTSNINHHFSLSIKSPYIFGSFSVMFAAIVSLSVALYFSVRTYNIQADNDLKYRYVKMKGETTPEQLVELENIFGPNRDNERIRLIREDVEAYEEAVQRQAALTEQARMKEQAARELDSKAKSIKDKSITDEPKK